MFVQVCKFCDEPIESENVFRCSRCTYLGCNQCISEDGFCLACASILECAECRIELEVNEDDICFCPECEEQFCPRCMVNSFCSDCTESLWKGRVLNHIGAPLEIDEELERSLNNFQRFALANYSLYELYHEVPIAKVLIAYFDRRKRKDSKPEQNSVIGEIVWVKS